MEESSVEHRCNIRGVEIVAYDIAGANSTSGVMGELANDCYGLDALGLDSSDVVVDVGAHTGAFASYVAKRFGSKVYSFEPARINYEHVMRALSENGVEHLVVPHHMGVSADGRMLQVVTPRHNTGGGVSFGVEPDAESIVSHAPSMTLNEIFEKNHIERCKLLKIDCEGMEYEVLRDFQYWDRVGNMGIEIHDYGSLPEHDAGALLRTCQERVAGQVSCVVIQSPWHGHEWR